MSNQESARLKVKRRRTKLIAGITIGALAAGAAAGLTFGYVGGTASASDVTALAAFGLPSVPDGFAAQTIIDAPTVEETMKSFDEPTKELVDELGTAFDLTFDTPSDPAFYPMVSADGKTQTLAQSVTGTTYTANAQTIPVERRQEAVDLINNVVQRHGFNAYTATPVPQPEGGDPISPLASPSVSISGGSNENQFDQYHVDIVSSQSTTGGDPIDTIVVYFTSYPHLEAKSVDAFKAAVVSDYKTVTG